MTDSIQIAVDSMGGDYGPAITVPAACDAVNSYRNLKISLYGNVHAIENALIDEGFALTDRISVLGDVFRNALFTDPYCVTKVASVCSFKMEYFEPQPSSSRIL